MIQLSKLHSLLKSQHWQSLMHYLDEAIAEEAVNEHIDQQWLAGYRQEKVHIIDQLNSLFHQSLTQDSLTNPHTALYYSQLQEHTLKLFARGLLSPSLTATQDTTLLTKLIRNSHHAKYLFVLYQQNICEIKQIYQPTHADIFQNVHLKLLYVASAFVRNLFGLVVFEEVVSRVGEFYVESERLVAEEDAAEKGAEEEGAEKGAEKGGNEVKMLVEAFTIQALGCIEELFDKQNATKSLDILTQKPTQRKHLFALLNLLHQRSSRPENQLKAKTLLSTAVSQLPIPFINIPELPSFWTAEHADEICTIYSPNQTLYYFGQILINDLPHKPEYSKLPPHLFPLVSHVCHNLLSSPVPLPSLSLKDNHTFFIHLFERFSILMGLLNRHNQLQQQISSMLTAIFNKKDLFCSPILPQTLWRSLIDTHDDMNFKMFCMGQYKKVLSLSPKELHMSSVHIVSLAFKTIRKLVNELEPNSNAQFIGYHITLTIYFISCMNKCIKFYSTSGVNSPERRAIFGYYFSEEKGVEMKQEVKEIFVRLKEGLKDRLEVYKMKSEQSKGNQRQEKEANQVSICIYRIEEEVKFD